MTRILSAIILLTFANNICGESIDHQEGDKSRCEGSLVFYNENGEISFNALKIFSRSKIELK